ncbi:sigma-70 family RNA polymerase sigma factor [Demequina aestuarii]|uniref:sigma-70 family RNA polymerase sigma factor n=1 Tax=Demequina aestuarii TaxID=327095 RepID=UPI000786567D|nr:sigma-70 family RNA polymerase sigma factor [Demequina aestuarii]
MRRWTRLYDELAGPRFPALLAYASLLTGDRDTADALVASALRRTFARPRRLSGPGEAELHVRRAIVAQFLARAREFAPAPPSTDQAGVDHRSDEPAAAPSAAKHAVHGQANPYAPPGHDSGTVSQSPPRTADQGEAEPASTSAGRPERTDAAPDGVDDDARLAETLLALPPQTRAVALLRHHDGRTPGQIAEQLALPPLAVRDALREVTAVVSERLGIALAHDDLGDDGHMAAEITVADHAVRP